MAPALAARSIMVCTLILGGAILTPRAASAAPARTLGAPSGAAGSRPSAARRPVAVIALAHDPQVEELANRLGTALVNHAQLAPLDPGTLIGDLVGEFLDELRPKIQIAEEMKERAEQSLAGFQLAAAISNAKVGHEALYDAEPVLHAKNLYADLALIVAKARFGLGQEAEATRYFGLVHQLTPGRRLDPALHIPEVVTAYQAARARPAGTGTLVVTGSGRLWIDGQDQDGKTRVVLPAGLHVVWLTGPDRETVGSEVYVDAGRETVLALREAPAPLKLRVQRARLELQRAPDPAARAVAMGRLARLLAVHDAVLITMPVANKVIVQTWHDQAEGDLLPGFSAQRLALGERPEDLLRPLAPPPLRLVDPRPRPLPAGPTPWYRRRPIQASIAAGVIGVIVGSVMLARRLDDRTVGIDGNIIFGPISGPPRTGP